MRAFPRGHPSGPALYQPSLPERQQRGGQGSPSRDTEGQACQQKGYEVGVGSGPYRSVFAQLAEGREGLLMRFAHLLDELPHLWRQRVALGALGLGHLLLLLVPVISHSCGGPRPLSERAGGVSGPSPQPSIPSLSSSHQTESCPRGGHWVQSGMHTKVHTHVSANRRDIHTQSVPWPPLQCPPGPHAEACPRACDHSMHAPDQLALPTSTPAHSPG